MNVKIPRGTQDILPEQVKLWQWIEDKVRHITKKYRYEEIRTPIFEHTEIFKEESVIQPISCKKKCILSKIVVEEPYTSTRRNSFGCSCFC